MKLRRLAKRLRYRYGMRFALPTARIRHDEAISPMETRLPAASIGIMETRLPAASIERLACDYI